MRAEPVVDPGCKLVIFLRRKGLGTEGSTGQYGRVEERAYFRILATSIISGMSSEKPAEERVRWIEYI